MWTPYAGRAKTMIYTKRFIEFDLLNSFNHMFSEAHKLVALEPRCVALRPRALQLGGAQTGYLLFMFKVPQTTINRKSIPWFLG